MKKDDNGNGNGNCQNSDETDFKVCGTGMISIDLNAESQACDFEFFNIQNVGENTISYEFYAIVTLKGSIDTKAEPPVITSVTPEDED